MHASQCPSIAPNWEDPKGVTMDAFLFGGRRATVVPLVTEAFDWEHGVFMGSIMGSEKTAAAAGAGVGELRFDPFAMLPFCGYHMADYFSHWLETGRREGARLPKIFMVNWFRKDDAGKFIWPGFGDNSRVLAWIFRRCDGEADAVGDPDRAGAGAGRDRDRRGSTCPQAEMEELLKVDPEEWRVQLPQIAAALRRLRRFAAGGAAPAARGARAAAGRAGDLTAAPGESRRPRAGRRGGDRLGHLHRFGPVAQVLRRR